MSSDKKLTLKRIIIFCILSYLPLYIITPIMNIVNGGPIFESNMLELSPMVQMFASLGMLAPAVANILTRLITKEGIKNSYLCLNFKGNFKSYLASVFVPLGYAFIGLVLVFTILGNGMSINEMIDTENIVLGAAVVSQSASLAIYMFIPFFGEEFGWRAYLTPKMTELMPEPLAVFVSGIIWGLWHAPLTVSGHNFGTDYPFFPFLGILLMCLMCANLAAFLTLITKRTGSVFPASIAHGINNQAGASIMLAVIATESFAEKVENVSIITAFFIQFIPMFVVGIISYIILIKDYMKSKR